MMSDLKKKAGHKSLCSFPNICFPNFMRLLHEPSIPVKIIKSVICH